MDDAYLNCLMSVCCPPFSEDQVEAFVKVMKVALPEECKIEDDSVRELARVLFKHFELAPAGSLTEFKATIARLATGEAYKP
jgi:hypothetical protein